MARLDQFANDGWDLRVGLYLGSEVAKDRGVNVQSDEIAHLQLPDRRQAEPQRAAHGSVDVLPAGDAAIQQVPDFSHQSDLDAVDEEPRNLLPDVNRFLAD